MKWKEVEAAPDTPRYGGGLGSVPGLTEVRIYLPLTRTVSISPPTTPNTKYKQRQLIDKSSLRADGCLLGTNAGFCH